MGKQKGQNNFLDSFELTYDEVKALEARIRTSALPETDQKLLISLIATVTALRTMVLRGKAGMLSLLRKIFGVKTEKQKKIPMKMLLQKNPVTAAIPAAKAMVATPVKTSLERSALAAIMTS